MKNFKHYSLSTLLVLSPLFLKAENNTSLKILPYAFSTEATGVAGGVAVIQKSLLQPQTTFIATAFGGLSEDVIVQGTEQEDRFSGGFFSFSQYKLPFSNRLYFSIMGLQTHFPKDKYYFDGSNDSNQEAVLDTPTDSQVLNASIKYVLPMGEGLNNPDNTYTLSNGFVQNRENYGNSTPFVTGMTTLSLKAFYQKDTFDNASKNHIQEWTTNGLRFALTHDNTDFDLNPSRGYHFNLQYSSDYGQGDSTQSWDFIEFKYNHYIPLSTFSFSQQNVLAMSLWTGYSPSWDNEKDIYPNISANRPPLWEGARLGGMFKMRGYDTNRFSDKASFYATAEYRTILNYNPLKDNTYLPVEWFQVVAFVEAGRVNDAYNADLLTDMKYDVGLSLRAMVSELPIRFDVAYSEEGTNMWVMINQPFDF
ncbi:hypothetical protein MNB_SV-13-393 [hydrothermal vent metagenome]|uniref:Bacterial surface antigen (D15) domain-containing protein n=1 Tax=hydrothermal vent metagenome TaxID=652676 RepID=A0A1W1D1A1_9ZZZZ